jgi:hypothetical protein
MNGTIWANKLAAAKISGGAYGNVRFGSIVLKNSKVGERQESSGRDFERRSKFDVSLNSLR